MTIIEYYTINCMINNWKKSSLLINSGWNIKSKFAIENPIKKWLRIQIFKLFENICCVFDWFENMTPGYESWAKSEYITSIGGTAVWVYLNIKKNPHAFLKALPKVWDFFFFYKISNLFIQIIVFGTRIPLYCP